jgi:hypothetical protein
MVNACYGGYKELVLLMIDKGASDWNGGLAMACDGGSMELALLMIDKGAWDWNRGIIHACKKGYRELVILMLAKGADIDLAAQIYLRLRDIERLVKLGITKFGSYKSKADIVARSIADIKDRLTEVMIPVLAEITSTY